MSKRMWQSACFRHHLTCKALGTEIYFTQRGNTSQKMPGFPPTPFTAFQAMSDHRPKTGNGERGLDTKT